MERRRVAHSAVRSNAASCTTSTGSGVVTGGISCPITCVCAHSRWRRCNKDTRPTVCAVSSNAAGCSFSTGSAVVTGGISCPTTCVCAQLWHPRRLGRWRRRQRSRWWWGGRAGNGNADWGPCVHDRPVDPSGGSNGRRGGRHHLSVFGDGCQVRPYLPSSAQIVEVRSRQPRAATGHVRVVSPSEPPGDAIVVGPK
jgi:hypothetical protein